VLGESNHLDFIMGFLGWMRGEAEHVGEDRRGERKDKLGGLEVDFIAGLQD
jgi:hypothetical protein